jgi:hypothetical protein
MATLIEVAIPIIKQEIAIKVKTLSFSLKGNNDQGHNI